MAAKEATFAYHTASHDFSFKSADCSSKSISQLFEVKFSLARTKCEAVICSVLAPLSIELKEDLKEANFVTVSIDTSNMQEIKIVPVLE